MPREGSLSAIWREIDRDSVTTDQLVSHLESRVVALEEVMAARWPRRLLLRWRMGRELRSSVAGYDWVAGGFRGRRTQFVSDTWEPCQR